MNTLRFGAVAVLAAAMLPSCVAASRHYEVVDELTRAQDELLTAEERLRDAESVIIELDGGVAALEERARRAEELAAEKSQLASERSELERERQRLAALNDELGRTNQQLSSRVSELESAVTEAQVSAPPGFEFVVNHEEGLYGYSGAGDVFFAPGKADLTPEGKTALAGLARELAQHNRPIRVVGHTDTDPVKKTKELWPLGNIQLGAGRAMSVMTYLISQGLDEQRFSVMSYGQHRPRDTSKERNRRVEIMVEAL